MTDTRTAATPLALALLALAALATACGSEDARPGGPWARPPTARQKPPDAPNRPPVIEQVRLLPEAPTPGAVLRAEVHAADPDGDPVHLRYEWRVQGVLVGNRAAEMPLVRARRGDQIEVRVMINDGRLEGVAVTETVVVGNRPPVVTALIVEPAGGASVIQDAIAHPQASDPDGDPVTFDYFWQVNGTAVPASEELLETSTLKRGDVIDLVVVASDGQDESEPFASDPISVLNTAPTVVSDPAAIRIEGGTFHYQVRAEDPDGDRAVRYRLAQAPEGMAIDAVLGALSWTPTSQQQGVHDVEVVVDDLQGGNAIQRFSVRVPPKPPAGGEADSMAAGAPNDEPAPARLSD